MSTGLQQVGFHNVSTYVEQLIEYQTNFISLKIHFNKKLKSIGEFGHALGIVGKPSLVK
jgi:hypothetical protein